MAILSPVSGEDPGATSSFPAKFPSKFPAKVQQIRSAGSALPSEGGSFEKWSAQAAPLLSVHVSAVVPLRGGGEDEGEGGGGGGGGGGGRRRGDGRRARRREEGEWEEGGQGAAAKVFSFFATWRRGDDDAPDSSGRRKKMNKSKSAKRRGGKRGANNKRGRKKEWSPALLNRKVLCNLLWVHLCIAAVLAVFMTVQQSVITTKAIAITQICADWSTLSTWRYWTAMTHADIMNDFIKLFHVRRKSDSLLNLFRFQMLAGSPNWSPEFLPNVYFLEVLNSAKRLQYEMQFGLSVVGEDHIPVPYQAGERYAPLHFFRAKDFDKQGVDFFRGTRCALAAEFITYAINIINLLQPPPSVPKGVQHFLIVHPITQIFVVPFVLKDAIRTA
ncbi:hypothetical protein CBR_g55543 [Chara braunii]|uniref:CHASE domain-containing protein n=1 Tax=Chara braunii TaxID=69332 RepID=A0A388MDA2_CHABU|nr:hypothetical protein CBR_g55543 [Chara braunii]|eukprot:GBG92462.1 hypothetical protein CBR_g55543 [Chara braunii]